MTSRSRYRRLLAEAPDPADAIEIDGVWTTWGTLRRIADQLEQILGALGLGAGARIGLVVENRPEHVGVILSLVATDRCLVTFSGLQPPARLADDIRDAQVPVVVGSAELLAADAVVVALSGSVSVCLSADGARVIGGAVEPVRTATAPGVTVEMLTSGTTGRPKRVPISDRQFDAALTTSVPAPPRDGLFRSGVTLVTTPLVHIGGFWGALGPLYAGRRIALMPKFALEPWLDVVERHRPRAVGLVPAALRAILDAEVPADRLASVDVATIGTAHCPEELVDVFLERYGIRVLPVYGATEFAGAVAGWSIDQHVQWWATKKGSAGRPLPGVSLQVVDENGQALEPGVVGRLEVRSPQSPAGSQAWLRTSDLAAIDTDGFLWIHGRADDMIVRGGFKVDPQKIRKVLEAHASVGEAAIAPVPDDRLGHVPVAAVELCAPADHADHADHADLVAELDASCRAALLPYEVPRRIVVLDELPRTPSSKVSRVDLLGLLTDHSV